MNGPPYQTIDDVINSPKKRGMYFEDEEAAKRLLEFVGAWRLRPYWHPFESKKSRAYPRKFIEGTTFERVRAVWVMSRILWVNPEVSNGAGRTSRVDQGRD